MAAAIRLRAAIEPLASTANRMTLPASRSRGPSRAGPAAFDQQAGPSGALLAAPLVGRGGAQSWRPGPGRGSPGAAARADVGALAVFERAGCACGAGARLGARPSARRVPPAYGSRARRPAPRRPTGRRLGGGCWSEWRRPSSPPAPGLGAVVCWRWLSIERPGRRGPAPSRAARTAGGRPPVEQRQLGGVADVLLGTARGRPGVRRQRRGRLVHHDVGAQAVDLEVGAEVGDQVQHPVVEDRRTAAARGRPGSAGAPRPRRRPALHEPERVVLEGDPPLDDLGALGRSSRPWTSTASAKRSRSCGRRSPSSGFIVPTRINWAGCESETPSRST